ncbi:MAG: hypothetical protein K9H58_18030 [Bacteroidales bacterium]|nr:hypothetical protein [Bacteroidales bacterium]
MKTIILETASHRNEPRLLLKFDYDSILIEKVKKLKGVRWSQSRKCWHIPVENFALNEFKEYFKDVLFEYNNISKSGSSQTACLNNAGNIEEKITNISRIIMTSISQ